MRIDAKTLARLLGITIGEVRLRTKSGFFRPVRDKYTDKAIRDYAAEAREIAAGRRSSEIDDETGETYDPVEWAARLKSAQAEAVEVQNAVVDGVLLPRADLEKALGAVIVSCKSRLETLPSRSARFIHGMSRPMRAELGREVRHCLTSMVRLAARARDAVAENYPE